MYPDLNFEGPTPIHEQITSWMRDNILNARWNQNYKLQAESDLATELGVSRGTVRKAIETLIKEGMLLRIHGRGTFVRENVLLEQQPTGRLAGFSADLLQRGIPFVTQVPMCEIVRPSSHVADMLKIGRRKKIFHMKRVRRIADRANILIENHIIYDLCPGIEAYDFSNLQFYITLENEFKIDFDWARRTYKARAAEPEIAAHLEIAPGAPIMYLEELYHIKGDRPAEFTRAWFNGDQFHITTLIKREEEKRETKGFYR